MMKIGTSQIELDSTKILKEDENEIVIPGVLAREGVFQYPEGKAFRPREELNQSLIVFDDARVVGKKHPDTMIVTKPNLIIGKIHNVTLNDKGEVRGDVHLFKKRMSNDLIAEVKSGVLSKNSMGFLYEEDATKGSFNGQQYDYVQRNIMVDHLAVGVLNPRDPGCVLGADDFSSEINVSLKGADAWEASYINDLPDASFAYIEDGGKKDDAGKTVPRSLRHLPFKNAQGDIDHDHLVNALARVSQSATLPEGGKTSAKDKLCGAVRSWNREHADSKIESEVCGVTGDVGAGDVVYSCGIALEEIERSRKLVS